MALSLPSFAAPVAEDGGATTAFIRDAISRGERVVDVPPVRARISPDAESAYFVFRGLSDTVIDFHGCDFFGARRIRALSLEGCTNVTVRNLTFDYDPLPYTQARITAVDAEGNWDLEVIDGYEAPPAECEYWPMQVYGQWNHELVNEMRCWAGFRLVKTGERTYRVTGGQNKTGEVGDIAVWSVRDPGALPEPCTIMLKDSAGCTLENVTLYSTSHGFGIFELQCSGNVYRNCTLDRRPPETDIRKRGVRRLRSGNHDAFHSKSASVGPILDGCRFAYHCDDAVNLSTYYALVTAADGRRVEVAEKMAIPFEVPMPLEPMIRAGDKLQVLRRDGSNGPDVHVEAIEGRHATTEAQFAFLKTLGMWPNKERSMGRTTVLRLREGEALGPGDAVVPERMLCRGFAIRNCHIGPNRALGMRIRASDGVIENNVVERTTGSGLWIGPEIEWPEGPMSHNLTIRGNEFTSCGAASGQPAIYIGGHAADHRKIAPEAHRGIVVEGNRISDKAAPPVAATTGMLRDGELVVFLGDSITDGNAYAGILADWYLTRFPERDIRFVNSGVPGDQAWLAARKDEMEDRVFSLNPSAVVVMFGMNDCTRFDFGPTPTSAQIASRAKHLATFREATRRIATNILDRCGPVPLYLLSPHPWDDNSAIPQGKSNAEARHPDFYGKGAGMGCYADAVREVAEQIPGATLVDVYSAVSDYFRARRLENRAVAFSSDRTHPGGDTHLRMAIEILHAQNADGVVSDIALQGTNILKSVRAKVSEVKPLPGGGVAFTVLERSLPWVFSDAFAENATNDQAVAALDREILAFYGLADGDWTLFIDGEPVRTADAMDWESGVNLAFEPTTPQYRQAQGLLRAREAFWKEKKEREAGHTRVRRELGRYMEAKGLNKDSLEDRVKAAGEAHIDPAYETWLRRIWRYVAENWDNIDANRAACIAKWPALRKKAAPVPHRYELRPGASR